MKTEKEMRESDVPWFDTWEKLTVYVDRLINREHDYGTCVYAVSMASVAMFRYVAGNMGITGFQASCADMDIVKRIRHIDIGFRLFDYDDLMYPMSKDKVPTWEQMIESNKEVLAKKAKEKLAEFKDAHPAVKAHWEYLAGL